MPSNMAFREILTVLADLDQRLALTGETLMQVKCRQLSFITNLKANIKKTQIINLLLYLLAFKKLKQILNSSITWKLMHGSKMKQSLLLDTYFIHNKIHSNQEKEDNKTSKVNNT